MVSHPDGRTATYGSLAARAAQLPLPAGPFELKKPQDFRIIGKPTKIADCADIVSGRARYGIDAQMPGMLYRGHRALPVLRRHAEIFDDSAAKKDARRARRRAHPGAARGRTRRAISPRVSP